MLTGGATVRRWWVIGALMALVVFTALPVGAASPPTTVAPYGTTGGPTTPKPVGKAKTAPARNLTAASPAISAAASQTYTSIQAIPDPNGAANDNFGVAVAVSKDNTFAVISAPYITNSPGKVWVYTRDNTGQWVNPQLLPAPAIPPPNGAAFGVSVAINYDSTTPTNRVILVGASFAAGASGNGAAYAYALVGSTWTFEQRFTPTGTGTTDRFGTSVALSSDGNTALIGAPNATFGALSQAGVAYVFTRSGGIWNPAPAQPSFSDSAAVAGDNFGQAVSLSDNGNTALIGAQHAHPPTPGQFGPGRAYVYTRSGGIFDTSVAGEKVLADNDPNSTVMPGFTGSEEFGSSVSLSGDGTIALIGAPFHLTAGHTTLLGCEPPGFPEVRQTGSAYVFTSTGGTWSAPQELNEDDGTDQAHPNDTCTDWDGWSVSLSGDDNTAVVGAIKWGNNFAAGAVWAYSRSGATFVPLGQQPIQSPDATGAGANQNDAFGFSVSLPQQGTHILIGQAVHQVGGNDAQGEAFDDALSPDLAPAAGALPGGLVGTFYSQQFTATNGAGTPYAYATAPTGAPPAGVTDGPPPGVTINTSSGLFSGTPTTAGSYTFLVTATDKANGTTTQTYTLTIAPAGTITGVTNATAPFSTTAQNVTLSATVTDGIPVNEGTVTFTVTQGATTIGTPVTSATVASGAATASYALPASQAPGTYTLTAVYNPAASNPNFLTSTSTGGTLTIAAAATTTAVTNATAPFSATAQNVTLNATVSSVVPVNEGTVTFTITQGATTIGTPVVSGTVTNGAATATFALPGGTAAGGYTLTAVYNPAATNPAFATSASAGGTLTITADATTTTVANATAPFAAGAQNVTLTATISSTTTVNEGTVTFTVAQGATTIGTAVTSGTVTNGAATASYALPASQPGGAYTITAVYNPGPDFTGSTNTGTLTIGAGTVAVGPATLPNGTVGAAYSQTITATGGSGTGYTFTVTLGALPAGLALDTATGAITGTPTAAGTAMFTVQVTDSAANVGSQQYAVTVAPAATTTAVTNATAPFSATAQNVTLNATVSSVVPVNEGTVTFTITQGATTIGTAVVSGTVAGGHASVNYPLPPSTPGGAYTITAVYNPAVPNANFLTSTGTGALTIGAGTVAVNPATLPNGTVGAPYNQTIAASGGSGAGYQYAVTAGALPTGLALNGGTGAITGTPTVAGPFTFTVTVTDGAANVGSRQYTVTIAAGTVTPTGLAVSAPGSLGNPPTIKVGQQAQLTATATLSSGATADVTNQVQWSSSNPAVASVDASGTVTGKTGGTATITATYTLNGVTVTKSIVVTVGTPILTGVQPAPAPQGRPSGASAPPTTAPAPAPAPPSR